MNDDEWANLTKVGFEPVTSNLHNQKVTHSNPASLKFTWLTCWIYQNIHLFVFLYTCILFYRYIFNKVYRLKQLIIIHKSIHLHHLHNTSLNIYSKCVNHQVMQQAEMHGSNIVQCFAAETILCLISRTTVTSLSVAKGICKPRKKMWSRFSRRDSRFKGEISVFKKKIKKKNVGWKSWFSRFSLFPSLGFCL